MDFRICPACKQSVLDDDAQDCPFCGASMSGKPSAATPVKPTASATAVKKEADAKVTTAKKTAPKKSEPEDDPDADPFDIKSEVKKKMFLVRVKAVPGCRFQVKCPMCGTEGYIPEKQGGKDVKCRNSTCMVPVFTAPMPEKEVVEEEPKGLSANTIVGIVVACVLAIGVGTGYYIINSGEKTDLPQGGTDEPVVNSENKDDGPGKKNDVSPLENGVKPKNQVAKITLDEMKAEFFEGDSPLVIRVAQDRKNRRKLESRQIAAVTFALMADEKRMREQINSLDRVAKSSGVSSDYMAVRPLTSLAWAYLNKQKNSEGKKIFEEALAASKSLPESGDSATISTAVQLAALATILGDLDAARQLVGRYESTDPQTRDATKLVTVTTNQMFDYELESKLAGTGQREFPVASAVARVLASQKNYAAAKSWAESAKSQEEKSECQASVAMEIALQTASQNQLDWKSEIDSAVKTESATVRGFVFASATLAFAATKQSEHVKTASQIAVAELEKTENYPSAGSPDLVTVHRGSFQIPQSTGMAAKSYAALAQANYIINNFETGWEMSLNAVNLAQKATPPLRIVDRLVKELENDKLSVDRQLRTSLNLINDNQVRREFSQYRQNLTAMQNQADEIQKLQSAALLMAAEFGQTDSVWGVVKSRDSSTGTDWAPLLDTEFSGTFREVLIENGNEELLGSLKQTMGRRTFKGPPDAWVAERRARRLVNDGQISNAFAEMKKFRIGSDELQGIILKIGSQQSAKGEYENASKWCDIQKDTLAKEQLLRLVAGHSVKNAKAGEFWTQLRSADLSQTEKGMVCLGTAQAIDW